MGLKISIVNYQVVGNIRVGTTKDKLSSFCEALGIGVGDLFTYVPNESLEKEKANFGHRDFSVLIT